MSRGASITSGVIEVIVIGHVLRVLGGGSFERRRRQHQRWCGREQLTSAPARMRSGLVRQFQYAATDGLPIAR